MFPETYLQNIHSTIEQELSPCWQNRQDFSRLKGGEGNVVHGNRIVCVHAWISGFEFGNAYQIEVHTSDKQKRNIHVSSEWILVDYNTH
jgi:hypothetical protein